MDRNQRLSAVECWCGVSEITIHSLRSNWPGARREGGSVCPAILDRLSNEGPGQFQRNPKGGMPFGRRRCCSLLTDPLRDMFVARALASAQNPLPRMYSYFGDTTLTANHSKYTKRIPIRAMIAQEICFRQTPDLHETEIHFSERPAISLR